MNSPVTTVDGVRGTIRSIRWSPLLVTPVAASVALLGAQAVADPAAGRMTLVGEAGLAFTAVAPAFLVDDGTLDAAPATPIEARARLVARAVVAVPVAVAGWLLVLAVYHVVTSSAEAAGVGDRAQAGLTLASAALACAALGGKLRSIASPGAAGVGAMACVGVVLRVSPGAWLEALPPGDLICPAVILFGLVTVTVSTREPAR